VAKYPTQNEKRNYSNVQTSHHRAGVYAVRPTECPKCGKLGVSTWHNNRSAYKHSKLFKETTYCLMGGNGA